MSHDGTMEGSVFNDPKTQDQWVAWDPDENGPNKTYQEKGEHLI